jgi:opacity protein-like surface antigen
VEPLHDKGVLSDKEEHMDGLAKLGSAAALTVALMGAAYAQQYHQYLPDKGTSEIDFAASLNFEPTESQALFGRYGYFLNRNLQLGLDASFARIENGNTAETWDAGVFANWHFPTASQVLPYAGLFLGVSGGSGIDSSTSWGAQGGAKYFFNPNVAGFAELRWRDLEESDDQFGIFFGLSVFFR